jgi:hypothetical protein
MATVSKPDKEQVRAYLQQRRQASAQPPSMSDIRRRLGWHLIVPRQLAPR